MNTGTLYINGELAPLLLDPMKLNPGNYNLRFVDPALGVFGEKTVTMTAGKTLEIKREDFSLRPIEQANQNR